MKTNTDLRPEATSADLDRRRMAIGLLAVIGGSALAGRAEALPRTARSDFFTASRTLAKYGIAIDGHEEPLLKKDVIDLSIQPLAQTDYNSTIELPDDRGAVIPCVRTSHFENFIEFVHQMPGPVSGEVIPCVRTFIAHGDLAGLIPCWFEHYDEQGQAALLRTAVLSAHQAARVTVSDAIGPENNPAPLTLDANWSPEGQVSRVNLDIGAAFTDRGVPFRLTVGNRSYELKGDELVEA